jgi:hypothetical protein
VAACSNPTPCLRRSSKALFGSQSNLYRKAIAQAAEMRPASCLSIRLSSNVLAKGTIRAIDSERYGQLGETKDSHNRHTTQPL